MGTSLAARKSGVVIPHRARWHQRIVAALIYGLVCGVAATVRFRLHDPAGVLTATCKGKRIFATWHNRLAFSLIVYRRYVQPCAPERRLVAMVSASRDGGLLARILELFGVEPVRGSSSRRGPQALLEMVTWAERGYDLAITPDGPRGPRYEVQDGVIATAQLAGVLIVPVSYHLSWKIQAKSWDRFQVPLPFGRCDVHIGEAVCVPREATEAEREVLRKELEAELRAITRD